MNLSDNAAKKLFMILGIVFLAVGMVCIIVSLRMNARMDSSRQVSATVVEVVRDVEHNSDINPRNHMRRRKTSVMYTSVYEYMDGGEVRRYTSNVSTSKQAEIGSETTLYISEDGKVYERSGAAVALFVGIGFAALGGIFTLISAAAMRKKPAEAGENVL